MQPEEAGFTACELLAPGCFVVDLDEGSLEAVRAVGETGFTESPRADGSGEGRSTLELENPVTTGTLQVAVDPRSTMSWQSLVTLSEWPYWYPQPFKHNFMSSVFQALHCA